MDEAARFRGYTDSAWQNEPAASKSRVIAHFLEHNIRESFAYDRAKEEAKQKEDRRRGASMPDFSSFRQGTASR